MTKQSFSVIALLVANAIVSQAATVGGREVYPDIAETSHASPHAVNFFREFFTTKTTGYGDDYVRLYNTDQAAYYDSTLGLTIAHNRSQLVELFGSGGAASNNSGTIKPAYPLRILGDTTHGAVVYFVDTPGVFGPNEIRTITSFDFSNGTIIRQLDNWDGRGNDDKTIVKGDAQYPNLGLPGLEEVAADTMKTVATQLSRALAAGNATTAAALFSYDAVFEDLTLRARIEGQFSIKSYLQRALSSLPYGPGAELTHILGSARGGGYEWRPTSGNVRYGITALELNESGKVTRFTAVWDGSVLSQTSIKGLASLAPTP